MLTRFTNFRPKLTPFVITSWWLGMTNGGCGEGEGFEVCTYMDDLQDYMRAKVVIGPSGAIKHAWDRVKDPHQDRRGTAAHEWREHYAVTLASMWQPFNVAHANGLVYDGTTG